MAFLQIKSNNPDLGYVLRKNPASGLSAKSLRQGTLFGYFTNREETGIFPQEYNIYFQDADNDISYKTQEGEEFEYNNLSRYNSSLFPLDAIYNYLDSAIKTPEERDVIGEHSITISSLECSFNAIDIFQKSFTEYEIETVDLSPKNYMVTIKTNTKTIRELLNFTAIFCIYNALKTKSLFFSPDEQQIVKYMNCLNIIDAPYLVRYAFKVNFIRSQKMFDKYKNSLETTSKNKLSLVHGSAMDARIKLVKEVISLENNILDIGCGEGKYVFMLAPKLLEGKEYIAIDQDKELVDGIAKKAEFRQIDNIIALNSLSDYLNNPICKNKTDIIMIEMIEHMEYTDVVYLVHRLTRHINFNKILITTPNKEFSKHYALEDDELRHDDHKFEFNEKDAKDFISDLEYHKLKVTQGTLGDTVDGIQPHFTFLIERA